jgi:hypothetical protein
MWKRKRTWFSLIALVGIALAVYFEPTHCVRGWLWGEAFFDGRPTSWWRGVVERDLKSDPQVFFGLAPPPPPTFWQRCQRWIGAQGPDSRRLFNENAELVLRQLQQDQNANIAGFAADILAKPPRDVEHPDVDVTSSWMKLVGKHNLHSKL